MRLFVSVNIVPLWNYIDKRHTNDETSAMRSRMDELLALAENNDGFVTATQARLIGIKDSVLARLTQRGKLQRVARGVYRIPHFPSDPLAQYREAVLWARADSGPKKIALSHETALAVYRISDANPSRVHITVPKTARLRRQRPKWVEIHRADLRSSDIETREGLPVTSVEKTILQIAEDTGRVGLARGALRDARKEGYITSETARALTLQLNRNAHASARSKANPIKTDA
jgi:predicted transcriptional regulator of viral defense system